MGVRGKMAPAVLAHPEAGTTRSRPHAIRPVLTLAATGIRESQFANEAVGHEK